MKNAPEYWWFLLVPAWVELPRFDRLGAVYEDVLAQRSVEARRERVALEPIVDRHVEVARLGEGLDLVVPVRGQHEGVARLDLHGEDARVSVERVAAQVRVGDVDEREVVELSVGEHLLEGAGRGAPELHHLLHARVGGGQPRGVDDGEPGGGEAQW